MPLARKKTDKELRLPRGFLSKFAIKRGFRILPVFWIAAFWGLMSLWIIGALGEDSESINGIMLRFFMIAHLLPIPFEMGNPPLATVVVEFWLYATYGIIIGFFAKNTGKKFWGTIFIVGMCFYLLGGVGRALYLTSKLWSGSSIFVFFIFWWMGAWAAEITFGIKEVKISRLKIIALTLFLFSFFANHLTQEMSLMYHSMAKYAGQFIFATSIALLLIIWTRSRLFIPSTEKTSVTNSVGRVLKLLGEKSYTLYAIHTPVIYIAIFTGKQVGLESNGILLLSVILVGLFTQVIWRLVERPTHKMGRQLATKYLRK